MTPQVDFIVIKADVLGRVDLPDKAKMLLGLIAGFSPNPLTISNERLGQLLGTSAKNISRLLSVLEEKKLIKINAGQSRWRRVYLLENAEVEDALLPQESSSKEGLLPQESSSKEGLLPHFGPSTSAKMGTIIKEYNGNTISLPKKHTKSKSGSLKAPSEFESQAASLLADYSEIKPPSLDDSRSRAKKNIIGLLKKGTSPDDLRRAVGNYRLAGEVLGRDAQFCYNAGNFFGRDEYWKTYSAPDWTAPTPQCKAGQAKKNDSGFEPDWQGDAEYVRKIEAIHETQRQRERAMA